MLGENSFEIRTQRKKIYQNDEIFFLGLEKVSKIHDSVVLQSTQPLKQHVNTTCKSYRDTLHDCIHQPLSDIFKVEPSPANSKLQQIHAKNSQVKNFSEKHFVRVFFFIQCVLFQTTRKKREYVTKFLKRIL